MKKRNIVVKAVTFVLFGLLIASFAVWGIGDIFQVHPQQLAVAEVGKTRIEQQDFARALNREVNRLSARLGQRMDSEQARAFGIVDQVVGQLVGRALVDQKVADLGLTVTEDLLKRRIVEDPAFEDDTGRFSRARFAHTLQISNLSEQEYLERLRRDILRQQLVGAINETVPAPRALAETLFAYREETRTARALRVPKDTITEIPEPDQAALQAFHGEFSSSFMASEFRAATFIHLRAEDLAAEISISETELRAEFEARRDELRVPERRRLTQAVYDDQAAADAAMDRLRGGASFESVARETTGDAPAELGLVERGELPGALAEAAFAPREGEVSAPVQTDFGWHILKVEEVIPAEEPDFETERQELRQDMAMAMAIDSAASIANQIDDELAAGLTLEEVGRALGLKLRQIEAIDREGLDQDGEGVPDLPLDGFIQTIFDTAPGEDSLLSETGDGGYFILRVDGVTPAQLRPLDEVRDQVVALWRDAHQAEKVREVATALADRARNGESLEDIAQAEGYSVETTVPLTRFESDPARSIAPSLAGKLFDLKRGEIDTVLAPDGHVVFELLEIQAADTASQETAVTALSTGLSNAMRNDMLEQFMANLRAEYSVTVNQTAIDNVLTTF